MGKRIEWKGGECPEPRGTSVKVWFKNGDVCSDSAQYFNWEHSYGGFNIIAYEVIEEAKDAVNHPEHYTNHPSGIECIQITEHMSFCLGNAVKYIWRSDLKGNAIEDLKKAEFYIKREIQRREALAKGE